MSSLLRTLLRTWHKAVYCSSPGVQYGIKYCVDRHCYVLRPFSGDADIRLAVHHLDDIRILGPMTPNSIKERGLSHLFSHER